MEIAMLNWIKSVMSNGQSDLAIAQDKLELIHMRKLNKDLINQLEKLRKENIELSKRVLSLKSPRRKAKGEKLEKTDFHQMTPTSVKLGKSEFRK
jgi:hypothetical protein